MLRDLSKIAAAAHAPFFAAADSGLMGMDSWNELMNPRDLSKLFDTPEYAAWKSLRDSDDAKYVGLCMPRVLARVPYGAKTDRSMSLRSKKKRTDTRARNTPG